MTSLWTTGCRNWVLTTAVQANDWAWWAPAFIVLLSLFSFSWSLKKTCIASDIAWSFIFFFSHFRINIYSIQQPCQCFILSHYSALRYKGVNWNKTVRHLRTCSWYPQRTLVCFENSSSWLERMVFGQLCNGNLHSRQLYLSLRMAPILDQSEVHLKLSDRYSQCQLLCGTEQNLQWDWTAPSMSNTGKYVTLLLHGSLCCSEAYCYNYGWLILLTPVYLPLTL